MRERVNVIIGKQPMLLVAPHGPSDANTALIAEMTAANLKSYAVVNHGFDRGEHVDVDKDIADCNRVDHCLSEVVYDEFLKPILKIKDKVLNGKIDPRMSGNNQLLIVYIHGAGDIVHTEANERIDVIVGYGLGNNKDSLTCSAWKKNLFVDKWRSYSNEGEVYEGSGAGRYAGRSSNNMNQYFRKHELNRQVHSLQLEFPFSMRNTEERVIHTSTLLNLVLKEMMNYESYDKEPKTKLI